MATITKDLAEEKTEQLLKKLEKQIRKEYETALVDLQKKCDDYLESFRQKDERKRELVASGELDRADYFAWRRAQIITGERWQNMVDLMARELTKVDLKARNLVFGYVPDAYATNFNYSTYEIEKGTNINTSFTLYSRDSVERLFKKNPKLLPKLNPNSPTAQKLKENKALIWNKRHLQSAITQGILQGESIPKISERLRQVTNMDEKASIRNARTMMTSAQNGGRLGAYERAAKLGIEIKKQWVATLDKRTRDSHQDLDGEIVDWNKPFSNKLMFPADPNGKPEEVYNCRCAMRPIYPEYQDTDLQRYDQLNDTGIKYVTYNEWAGKKNVKKGNQKGKQKETKKIPHLVNEVTELAKARGVVYNEPKEKHRTFEQIVDEVGGGDMTSGSCMSLSLCYVGNKAGYDVLDFRGGNSLKMFSSRITISKIAKLPNVKALIEENFNDIKGANVLLSTIKDNREYILATGGHAAVIRRTEGGFEYLELQSARSNGFKPLDNSVLVSRFGCKRSRTVYGTKVKCSSFLFDIDSLTENDDFLSILGYVNTDADKQKKGGSGHER